MSPTIFRYKSYRFFFFSREEPRMHVHVISPNGEAKIWLDPEVELSLSNGLKNTEISDILKVVKDKEDEIRDAWNKHFGC